MAGVLLTQKSVKLGGISLLVLGTLVGGYLVGSPLITSYNTASEEYSDAQTQLETSNARLVSLESAKTNYDKIVIIDDSLKIQFPQVAETEDYTRILVNALAAAGLPQSALKSVKFNAPQKQTPKGTTGGVAPVDPTEEAPADAPPADTPTDAPAPIDTTIGANEFATVEVGVNVEASPQQVQQFLNYLNTADRAILINTFSIKTTEGKASLSFTGNLIIYPAILTPEDQLKASTDEATEETGIVEETVVDPATP